MITIPNYLTLLSNTIQKTDIQSVEQVVRLLQTVKDTNKNIFIMGNGGSAASASHFVCDFTKGCSYGCDKRFKVMCLSDNVPMMMAYSNDVAYDAVFVEPLKNYMNQGDLVIGISGSGNSKNVVNAIDWANQHGGTTVAMTGYDGGVLKSIAQYNIHIPVNDMQIAEDMHMLLIHSMAKQFYIE